MKPLFCLLLSLIFWAQVGAYEWTGTSPDLNGVTIASVVDGQTIVLFGEGGKVYSNVLAKAGCDFGILTQAAGGAGDSENHYTYTSIIANDQTGAVVRFKIGLVYHKNDSTYGLVMLVKEQERAAPLHVHPSQNQ